MPAQDLNRSRMHHLPRRFRTRCLDVDAMEFDGSSASGQDIVSWVFLRGGVASWTEPRPAFTSDDGLQGCPAQPGILVVCGVVVEPGYWVLDDKWTVMDDAQLRERFQEWD